MKELRLCIGLVFLFLTITACSDKLKSDAEEAHELMQKSIKATLDHDYEAADDFFRKYKEIENHYKNADNFQAFEKAYWELKADNKN